MRIKRVRCHACGGPKVTQIRTAYVYCDWCGVLTDWDFRVATQTQGSLDPGPHYEALRVYLHPRMEEARLRSDRPAFFGYQRQLFELHVQACPAAYSPRVRDAQYRHGIVEYAAAQRTEEELDPALRAHTAQIADATKKLRWEGAEVGGIIRSDTFWRLFGATHGHAQASVQRLGAVGMVARHPDRPPPELLLRIASSSFAQQWLAHLGAADAQRMLETTRLAGDYVDLPDPQLERRACLRCAAPLDVVPGARRALCEACGLLNELAAPALACPHCGGAIAFPPSALYVSCGFCRASIRRDG